MIEIEEAEDYRRCRCCYGNGKVKKIAFRSERHGVVVALCSDCVSELLRKLDAVEIVRCKDCKHRGTDDCPMHYKGVHANEDFLKKVDNDFCSYGERKDVIQK